MANRGVRVTFLHNVIAWSIAILLLGSGCVQTIQSPPSPVQPPPPASEIETPPQPDVIVLNAPDAKANQQDKNVPFAVAGVNRAAPPPPPPTPEPLPRLSDTDLRASGSQTVATGAGKTDKALKSPQHILDDALEECQLAQEFWQKGELENALEALDQAYGLILNLQSLEDQPDLAQQKEDLRFLISKRILEIHASRHIVVNGNHDAIPVDINKHVEAEIKRFTTGAEKDFFRASYRRSGRYRAYIAKRLRSNGLPEELSWMPLIESGFKVRALSRARALGLWQFIPSTGYKFGLSRNTYIDERLDPEKATTAAIAYLKELHQIFGDWSTVLAAYNCGEGRVLRIIRTQNINYLDNFWDLYTRLPRETARYVPRFLATLHIVKSPRRYGLDKVALDQPLAFESVKINKQIHLKQAARKIGVDEATLKALNPELRYRILPNEVYPLRVPPGKGTLLEAKLSEIPVYRPPQPAYVIHRVRRGETLSTIARRYRTSMKRIARANSLNRRYFIVAGQRLKIPRRGGAPTTVARRVSQKPPATHVVHKGDSLWNIARRYGTTVRKIQRLNRLQGSRLYIGQRLKIPGGKSSDGVRTAKRKIYKVRRGDSPFTIARRNKMDLNHFLRINQLTSRSKIYPGQKLYIE